LALKLMPLHALESRLAESWPPAEWQDMTVLVAVSGGADSVALLRAMAALKSGGEGRLCAAHFNHKLRTQADEDEQFVVGLCRQLQLPCETGMGDVARLAADAREGIELAARRARYEFFKEIAGRLGARFVLTAHTADDQAETILHRIVRGTGIAGLAGMARSRRLGHATLLRPLLGVRHRELEEYLRDIGQAFRVDASNTDRRFMRNRIRHELLPILERHYNRGVSDSLLRLGTLAADVQGVINGAVDELRERAVWLEGEKIVEIDGAALARCSAYLVRELLVAVWRRQGWPMRAMGFEQWEQLSDMLLKELPATPGSKIKRIFPGNVSAAFREGILRLSRAE
jgi:tRNA(Ile)-lysidine synthase